MSPFTEIANGKCQHCGDQLLSVASHNSDGERRLICAFCITNERDEMRNLLTNTAAGVQLWMRHKAGEYLATLEEDQRMCE